MNFLQRIGVFVHSPRLFFQKSIEKYPDFFARIWGGDRYNGIPTDITLTEKLLLYWLARGVHGNICEIGSYLGASACVLSLAKAKRTVLYCVDTWENDAMSEGKRDTYETFCRNTQDFSDIKKLRGLSQEMVRTFSESSRKISFLFIDGDHCYEAVLRDWNLYKVFMDDEATVVFHDYGAYDGVRRVVNQFIRPIAQDEYFLPNLYACRLKRV